MASFWGLIVALLALNAGFSVAQNATSNNTVIAATPTTPLAAATLTIGGGGGAGGSSQIVPTPTASVAPTSTSASTPSGGFDTYLKVNFTASTCPSANDTSLTSFFRDIYKDAKFHLKDIAYSVTREIKICHFNFILTFGPGLKKKNIIEVLEAKLKSMKNIDGMTVSKITTEVHVDGASLGEFKATAHDCQRICCGAGGQIPVTRTCSPSDKCISYTLNKTEPDCTNVCSDKCSGVTMYKTSLLILLFGVFMNWFLK